MSADRDVVIDFPACLAADFPAELPIAARAVDQVLDAIQESSSFQRLEDRSPGLRGNDWSNYLRCSEARMVRVAHHLARYGVTNGRLLDYGAYFGNFAQMFHSLGFTVDAIDAYQEYSPSLDPVAGLLKRHGIGVLDFADAGRDMHGLPAESYDVVLCMGVIEHVPHTARVLLEALDRILKRGGVLIADTPNLAQLPNRQKLARGESVWPPIDVQYHATVPFEGHHREYTVEEMVWMAQEAGHDMLAVDLYNYSVYGQRVLKGRDAVNHWRMIANPAMRELVMIVSRKSDRAARRVSWQDVFTDTERCWRARIPAGQGMIEQDSGILAAETMVTDLQAGINERDRMLQNLQAGFNERDRMLQNLLQNLQAENAVLMDRLGALQFAYDMTPVERLKRAARRWFGRGA